MWIFQKLANGLGLASINAVEVHSKQTSTDLNATQKHANGLEPPSISSVEVHLNQPRAPRSLLKLRWAPKASAKIDTGGM